MSVRKDRMLYVELNQRGRPRTLGDLEGWIKEAYENGFDAKTEPSIDGHLFYSASVWRRES